MLSKEVKYLKRGFRGGRTLDIEKVGGKSEISNILGMLSEATNSAVWLATGNAEIIERVGEIRGTQKHKDTIATLSSSRIFTEECLPLRLDARNRALEEKGTVVYKNSMGFYAFTSPIFDSNGEFVGFLEGDFAKARELDEEYKNLISEKASKYGFPAQRLLDLLEDEKIQDKECMRATVNIAAESIKLYISLSASSGDFYTKLYSIGNGIRRIAKNIQVLGINAAIEAARLGEEGTGFAVVAGEIKKVGDYVFSQVDELEKLIADYKKES